MNDGKRFDTAQLGTARRFEPQHRSGGSRKPDRNRRVPGWVYRVILILVLCVLAVLGWYNRANRTPANIMVWVQDRVVGMGVGDGFPHEISGSSVSAGNFLAFGKNLAVASDTSLTVLNSSAKEIVNRQHSYKSPVLKIGGARMLLYNLGGTGCMVGSVSKTLVKFSTDREILSGAISPGGQFALLTRADGYCGLLTAYTADGKVQSHYWFSDYYPTAVALNANGTKAVVTAVSTKDGALVSALYLIDLNSGSTVQPVAVFQENMIFSVSWDDSDRITAVGDTGTCFVDAVRKTKTAYDYNGLRLTSWYSDSGNTALALSPGNDSSQSRLVVLDGTGKQKISENLPEKAVSVSVFGDTAAALSGGKALFYSLSSGAAEGSKDAGTGARAVALKDESSAYVLGVSEIRLIGAR